MLANKEKSINAGAEALCRKLRSQEAHLKQMEENMKQRRKELEKCEGALRCCEEEIMSQEQDLKHRGKELEKCEGALQCYEEEITSQKQELKKRQGLWGQAVGHERAPSPSSSPSQRVCNSML